MVDPQKIMIGVRQAMKKTIRFFAIAVAFAAMAACNKEQDIVEVPSIVEDENTPAATSYDPAKYLTGFGAAMEETKADLADATGDFSWTNGDQVKVIRSDGQEALYAYSESKFAPVGEPLEKNGDPMHVFFPAGNFVWDTDQDHVQFTMPAAFESLTGIMNPMAAVVPADATAETSITMLNLGAIYEIRAYTDNAQGETLTKVELSNSEVIITGSAAVSFSGGIPSIGALDGSKFVTCELAAPVTLSSTPKSVYFFLPVTGTDEFDAMTVKLVYGKTVGSVEYEPFEFKTRNSAMTVTRSMRKHMNFKAKGFFSGGDGSEANPYLIASADDFKAIKTKMESTFPTEGGVSGEGTFFGSTAVYYKQTADIDFGNEALPSIGIYNATLAEATPFQGTYDGNNKKLEKFTVSGDVDDSVGLFAYVNNATLKNIKVVNAAVTGTNTTGILTGRCIGTTSIENCSLEGGQVTGRNSVGFIAHITGSTTVKGCSVSNLTVTTADSGSNANNQGGVVGFAGGTSSIESCSTSGSIQFTGTASGVARGGIVGKFDSTGEVKDCINDATISNTLVNYTGGIAGQLTKGTITGCVNTGDVTGLGYVGGITGAMLPASSACVFVNKCRVDATIKGTGDENSEACVGGIVGSMQNGVLNTCIAKGAVENSWYDTGGIVGQIYANGSDAAYNRPYVFDCIAANDVKCTRTSGSSNIGGVVGRINRSGSYTNQYTAVDNCIGLNQTITATIQYAGAFVGNVNASATNNDRVRVRNCISLVDDSHLSVNTSANYTGGFAGGYLGALVHCYYLVSDNNQTAVSGTTAANNLTKSVLTTLTGADFCTAHSTRATGYNLTVNGVQYKSSGWTLPSDASYPVPTTLYNLGSEYYK